MLMKLLPKNANGFMTVLLYWEANVDQADTTWTAFLLRDDVPNKERLLRQKQEQKKSRNPGFPLTETGILQAFLVLSAISIPNLLTR